MALLVLWTIGKHAVRAHLLCLDGNQKQAGSSSLGIGSPELLRITGYGLRFANSEACNSRPENQWVMAPGVKSQTDNPSCSSSSHRLIAPSCQCPSFISLGARLRGLLLSELSVPLVLHLAARVAVPERWVLKHLVLLCSFGLVPGFELRALHSTA
jgi:hypothetical protein